MMIKNSIINIHYSRIQLFFFSADVKGTKALLDRKITSRVFESASSLIVIIGILSFR